MSKIQGRPRRGRFIYSKYFVVILLIVLGLVIKGAWNMYKKDQAAKDLLAASVKQAASLSEREQALKAKLDSFNTERGLEQEIRENLSVVKDGEKVISIVDGQGTNTASTAPAKTKSWLSRLFDF